MKKYLFGTILLLSLFLTTGCQNNEQQRSIVGKWKSIENDIEYYYIFNDDKTCSYEMTMARLDCTFEEDSGKLTILYNGNDNPTIYEYHFEKNNLIITDPTGKENKFIEEK